jgi:putative transposase
MYVLYSISVSIYSPMREDGIHLKSTRHCKYQSGHHFVWIPFKRRRIFKNSEIIEATKKYVIEAIENNGMELIAIEVDKTLMDHIHVFVSIPPRLSASEAVNVMKGYSSRRLRMEFPQLKSLNEKSQLWARSYYWGTTGNVSAQTVKRYIEECQG